MTTGGEAKAGGETGEGGSEEWEVGCDVRAGVATGNGPVEGAGFDFDANVLSFDVESPATKIDCSVGEECGRRRFEIGEDWGRVCREMGGASSELVVGGATNKVRIVERIGRDVGKKFCGRGRKVAPGERQRDASMGADAVMELSATKAFEKLRPVRAIWSVGEDVRATNGDASRSYGGDFAVAAEGAVVAVAVRVEAAHDRHEVTGF